MSKETNGALHLTVMRTLVPSWARRKTKHPKLLYSGHAKSPNFVQQACWHWDLQKNRHWQSHDANISYQGLEQHLAAASHLDKEDICNSFKLGFCQKASPRINYPAKTLLHWCKLTCTEPGVHRMVCVRRDHKAPVPTPCHEQGHLSLDLVAQYLNWEQSLCCMQYLQNDW